jgi:LacI family transcriptional regulator
MDKPNMKLLARELNLSVATISKALKDSHEISAATKQRVLKMAAKLNYKPNPYAGSLKGGRSKTIGVVIPDVSNSYFSRALSGIESATQEKGYHILIYLTHNSFSFEQSVLKDFQSGRVDGVIMSVASEITHSDHIRELQSKGIPVVFFDRVCEDIDTAKITTDDFESGYKATQHLIECGCKQIALLAISKSLSISTQRIEGYKKALSDNNISFKKDNVILCSNDFDTNNTILKKLMGSKKHPDGILATVEELITSVYMVCNKLKLVIPDDVKVVSFTNLQTVLILNPSLTTITQPAFEMGRSATAILIKALEFPGLNLKDESVLLPSSLIIRNSTVKGSTQP